MPYRQSEPFEGIFDVFNEMGYKQQLFIVWSVSRRYLLEGPFYRMQIRDQRTAQTINRLILTDGLVSDPGCRTDMQVGGLSCDNYQYPWFMMDAIILSARICYVLSWIFLIICKFRPEKSNFIEKLNFQSRKFV